MNRITQELAVTAFARRLLIAVGLLVVPVEMTHAQTISPGIDDGGASANAGAMATLMHSLTVSATDLDFGEFLIPASTVRATMVCNGGNATLNAEVATLDLDASDSVCGIIEVETPLDGLDIELLVSATPMLNETDNTSSLATTYTVYGSDGTARTDDLANIPADGSEQTSDSISVTTASTINFALGGSVNLMPTSALGVYSGQYTVIARLSP